MVPGETTLTRISSGARSSDRRCRAAQSEIHAGYSVPCHAEAIAALRRMGLGGQRCDGNGIPDAGALRDLGCEECGALGRVLFVPAVVTVTTTVNNTGGGWGSGRNALRTGGEPSS